MDRERLINLCLRIEKGANPIMQRSYIEALMDLCHMADPYITLDIGTNSGTSAMAVLCAMFAMEKFNFSSYTFDIHHGLYKKTQFELEARFMELGIPMSKLVTIERDFKALDPAEYLSPSGAPVFCFYDIHDLEDGSGKPNSPVFIEEWIPKMRSAVVAVHDVTLCEEDWERPEHWGPAPPGAGKVMLWTGQWFRGFGEARRFIDFLNERQIEPRTIADTSIIYFAVVDGEPV